MSRGASPAVAMVLLTALTVAIAASVGAVVTAQPADPPPVADLDLSVDATADRIAVHHVGGEAVTPDSLSVRVRVNGVAPRTPATRSLRRAWLSRGADGPV